MFKYVCSFFVFDMDFRAGRAGGDRGKKQGAHGVQGKAHGAPWAPIFKFCCVLVEDMMINSECITKIHINSKKA